MGGEEEANQKMFKSLNTFFCTCAEKFCEKCHFSIFSINLFGKFPPDPDSLLPASYIFMVTSFE